MHTNMLGFITMLFLGMTSHQDCEFIKNGTLNRFRQCDNGYKQQKLVTDWEKNGNARYCNPSCSRSYLKYFTNVDSAVSHHGFMAIKLFETSSSGIQNLVTDAMSSKLRKRLKENKVYKIKIALALSKKSKYATDKLFIWFEPVDNVLDFKKQTIEIDIESLAESPGNWFQFEFVYEAKDKEQQVNIGIAPLSESHPSVLQTNVDSSDLENNALYFVDDVSLVEI